MMRWIGLILALGGGLTAIIAGWGGHWLATIIGGLIFFVGMAALIHPGNSQ